MADGDVAADDGGMRPGRRSLGVDNGVPSWMFRAPADADRVHVAAHDGVHPHHLSSPISTSPITCALSSMKAVGWTRVD